MAPNTSLTRLRVNRLRRFWWLFLRWSTHNCLWAEPTGVCELPYGWLEFSSCLEVTVPLCKSTPFSSRALCSAPGSLQSARPRKHQRLSGKLLSNKVLIDLNRGGGGRGGGEGGSISLNFLFDEEGTLCGGLGTNTGSQMWKICHVTGANIQKDAHTHWPHNSLLYECTHPVSICSRRHH